MYKHGKGNFVTSVGGGNTMYEILGACKVFGIAQSMHIPTLIEFIFFVSGYKIHVQSTYNS